MSKIGVLALQGDFRNHGAAFSKRGYRLREIRKPKDLEDLEGLILPGGESTTLLRLLDRDPELKRALQEAIPGVPVLATCAGLVLCAREVRNPRQPSLGFLDLVVTRNGYGRQIRSAVVPLRGLGGFPDCEGVFIRAPRILEIGPEVRVLAERNGDPALVQQGGILAACFHPELEEDHPVLDLFLSNLNQGNRE